MHLKLIVYVCAVAMIASAALAVPLYQDSGITTLQTDLCWDLTPWLCIPEEDVATASLDDWCPFIPWLCEESYAGMIHTAGDAGVPLMETDGVLHTIPLDEIRSGGPPKDGIPSIDEPVFINATGATGMDDTDIIIGLEINGSIRAYPLFILVWHEIVNDEVGGVPVAVTYCPLCYTSQVFNRTIGDSVVEFGTTGKLYQSNLLMYDRLTDTYWSQGLGEAVKGRLSGYALDVIPFDIMTWGDWRSIYPETVVLSTDTGYSRAYGVDPYGSYYTEPELMFPVSHSDDRLHPKTIIVGMYVDGVSKAYSQSDVGSGMVINDRIGDTDILLLSMYDGNTRVFNRTSAQPLTFAYNGSIIDTQTGSTWNYDGVAVAGDLAGSRLDRMPTWPGFWFEWAAFHPQTLVYDDPN